MKLLVIASEAVDIVLLVVKDDYDEQDALDLASESADMRGDVYIEEIIDLPDQTEIPTSRPFVG